MRRLLAIALALSSTAARADCECLWQGSFADIHDRADLIVSATALTGKGNSLDFNVDRILRGNEALPQIRVWFATGDYCRPPAEDFPPGQQWVLALERIAQDVPGGFNPNTPNVSYGRIGDYALSNCGGYWLAQSGDVVTGNLIDGARWDREPKMTPVLVDLIASYVNGEASRGALKKASTEDPALRELMLDTKAFLRGDTEE